MGHTCFANGYKAIVPSLTGGKGPGEDRVYSGSVGLTHATAVSSTGTGVDSGMLRQGPSKALSQALGLGVEKEIYKASGVRPVHCGLIHPDVPEPVFRLAQNLFQQVARSLP